ncbi:hypothetical protein [Mycolicibacterium nivoides]|uniref:Uncharacterized protein n=1 Tax=Mycolicibacterium nivoides TaxID=2487344 RepID=A0ABW9LK50_9MYCO
MNTTTVDAELFIFNTPSPEALQQMPTDYYDECRMAGAGSVEIERHDHSVVIRFSDPLLAGGRGCTRRRRRRRVEGAVHR